MSGLQPWLFFLAVTGNTLATTYTTQRNRDTFTGYVTTPSTYALDRFHARERRDAVPLQLPLGHNCSTTVDNCIVNATCEPKRNGTTNGTCVCNKTHYSKDGTCARRIAAGEPCMLNTEDNPCVKDAVCNSGFCVCPVAEQFLYKVDGSCRNRLRHGEKGCSQSNDDMPCVQHAQCISTPNPTTLGTTLPPQTECRCNTNETFVNDKYLCELRKPGNGSRCQNNSECVENAICKNNRSCECAPDYYNTGHRCDPRLPLGDLCIDHGCLVNGKCVGYKCVCDDGSYQNGSICSKTLSHLDYCNMTNPDPKQCGNTTKCVFRKNDDAPRCACDVNHYFDRTRCERRIPVLSPCTVGANYGDGEEQCVDNATCQPDRRICECKEGFYMRSGRCPKRIGEGGVCNPWSEALDQCAERTACINARCSSVSAPIG